MEINSWPKFLSFMFVALSMQQILLFVGHKVVERLTGRGREPERTFYFAATVTITMGVIALVVFYTRATGFVDTVSTMLIAMVAGDLLAQAFFGKKRAR